jgi:hypothetical protein
MFPSIFQIKHFQVHLSDLSKQFLLSLQACYIFIDEKESK